MKLCPRSPNLSRYIVKPPFLKARRQISKKQCFEKYCSYDQACQFSASYGNPNGVISKT